MSLIVSPSADHVPSAPNQHTSANPVPVAGFKWLEDPAWSLERLWAEGAKPIRWIVEPIVAEGHQVILAGEPKSGKSLLASQLCLEIAKGPGQLLQISLPGVASTIEPGKKLPVGAFRIATKGTTSGKTGKIPPACALSHVG